MYCWLIVGVLVLLTVILAIVYIKTDSGAALYTSAITGTFGMLMLFVVLAVSIKIPNEFIARSSEFEQQRAFIASLKGNDSVENAALTSKKIELNGWLYETQAKKSVYGNWSFIPKEVFNIKPIE